MTIRYIVLFLILPTLILIPIHYFKITSCSIKKRCYAIAWTGMAIIIMGSIIYMVHTAGRKHHLSAPKFSSEEAQYIGP